jgi:hypothetical protein
VTLKTALDRAEEPYVSESLATRPTRPHRTPITIAKTSLRLSESRTVGLLFAVYAAYSLAIVTHPITEGHAFRQTQTAFIARGFIRHGINLSHPVVPVYGPNSEIPYELPWYQAIAATLSRAFHLSETVALRSTSTVFTLLTAYFVYRLTQRMASQSAGTIAAAVFLFCPFTLRWGRASLIESFTTAMTLGWVLSVVAYPGEAPRSRRVSCVGAIAGALACTSKVTTFLPWGVFLLPTFVRHLRARKWIPAASMATSSGLSIATGLLWTRHADTIKAAHPFTSWLTSKRLQQFNVGTISQRLSAATWQTIIGRSFLLIVGPIGLLGILRAFTSHHRSIRADVVALLGVSGAAIGVFTNLYVAHDYYQAAIAPALVIPASIGLAGIAARKPRLTPHILSTYCLIALAILSPANIRQTVVGAKDLRRISASISAITPRESGVIVTGLGWTSEILYFADRWGVMADGNIVTVERLRDEPYLNRLRFMAVANGFDDVAVDIIRSVAWVSPVDQFTFRLGPFGPRTGRRPPDGTLSVLYPNGKGDALGTPLRIPCDGAMHRVSHTTLSVSSNRPGVTFASDRWTLPALAGVLHTDAPGLRCFGPGGAILTLQPVPETWKP